MSAQPYSLHLAEVTNVREPRRLFVVTRPAEKCPYRFYLSREVAEAARILAHDELPEIGPWEVLEMVEVLP